MSTARHRGAVALAALLWSGCATAPAPVDRSAPAPEPPGVALWLVGSAFRTAAARDEMVALARDHTGRTAHVTAAEPSIERVVQSAAARLDKSIARTARAESRDGGCRKKARAVAGAVTEHADVLLRVQLDAKVASHPASDAERKDLGAKSGLAGMLSSVGLAGEDTVYETTLAGTVERTTFPGTTTTAKQRVRWAGRRLGRKDAPPPPSVRDAVAQALAAMPAPAASRWDAVARGLVSGGCPVMGTAVADAFLDDGPAKRRIRAAAAAALGPSTKPAESSAPPETAGVEIDPAPQPPPTTPEPAYSCTSLCTLQMVELCNNDRTLWSQHGSRWESTRCGLRRSEVFLEDCYRMQWLSGTYEQSCVRPCEESAEGRTRLMVVLRRSGCLRRPETSSRGGFGEFGTFGGSRGRGAAAG